MAAGNFERCLAETLKWEGGYSNNADDPGGPTMRGITQDEYDAWRKKQGKRTQLVRSITNDELATIYRTEYWDRLECDGLPIGYDLCVFDAGVNSGVTRAARWEFDSSGAIDTIHEICSERLAFLQGTGRLWRVFGPGWRRRVTGIEAKARAMAGGTDPVPVPDTDDLHAGMRGARVLALQTKLRNLGYPVGNADGRFGEQTFRAVVLFQHDNSLDGEPGVWKPEYDATIAAPMLPKRVDNTPSDLTKAGDRPMRRLNWLQRAFGWVFGAGVVGQVTDAHSVIDSLGAAKEALEPLQGVVEWTAGHLWLIVAVAAVGALTLVRLMISDHVENYRNMSYQGPAPQDAVPVVPVVQGVS